MDGSSDVVLVLPKSESTTIGLTGIKRKTFAGLQPKEWAFLIIAVSSILGVIGLTIYRLVQVVAIENNPDSPDFTLTIVILINAIFCLGYVLDGVLTEKEFEIYAYISAGFIILTYCIVEYSVNAPGRTVIKLIRLILASLAIPLNAILGICIAKEFGYLEFKIVGASEALQYIYRESTRFSCLLKLDLEVAASLVVLTLQDGTNMSTLNIVALAAGLPLCIIWVILGLIAMRKEIKWLSWVFGFVGFAEPAYIIFRLYKIYEEIYGSNGNPNIFSDHSKMGILIATLCACALALLIRLFVFYELTQVYKNFDKGLKERAFDAGGNEKTSLLNARKRNTYYSDSPSF